MFCMDTTSSIFINFSMYLFSLSEIYGGKRKIHGPWSITLLAIYVRKSRQADEALQNWEATNSSEI